MGDRRRSFTREFKVEAVRLVTEGKRRLSEVARELGTGATLLGRWRQEIEDDSEAFPGKGRLKPEDAELQRLKRECERLRMERDILKKAVAIFSEGKR